MLKFKSSYNPVEAIQKEIPKDTKLTDDQQDFLKKELFKSGIICESNYEFRIVLKLLKETGIL